MDKAGKNLTTSRGFRDGRDHAITVAESDTDHGLSSTSVPEIMSRMGWTYLDILKVDIEGAERFVFKDRETAAFLESVRSVAIEIHDEFGIREHIYELLRSFGFVLIDSGETTFGLNMRFSSR